ncbi:MAG: FAD-dependent oxidoreductase, partial [Chloroflexi bacterium]|nr:FAD-dependent oxidoreductase [Chloroflexota bacterium]
RERILEGARRLLPSIVEATLVTHTACLRPVTPDWLPILGRVPGYRNAWLATGAGKKGILLAPGIGKSIADLIATDGTGLPIDNFAPERFAAPVAG